MSDVVVGGLIGLGGVILGFALNAGWDWWRYREREEKRQANVRALVRLEIEENLNALKEIWNGVTKLPPLISLDHEEHEYIQRKQLAESSLLPWGRLMWESQAGFMADAIQEEKLKRAYILNKRLDAFLVSREAIRAAFETEEGRRTANGFGTWLKEKTDAAARGEGISLDERVPSLREKLRDFNQRTQPHWFTCQGIHNEAVSQGNPLD